MFRIKRRSSAGVSSPSKKQKITLYLNDNTPVRTIEVTGFQKNITPPYLAGYFDHAVGRVSTVSIIQKRQGDKNIRMALVTFIVPEDAASVICDPDLSSKFRFTIKQAAKVHQPKLNPTAFNFEQLNDDCLLHITSYLDFADVVNLSKSSTRLQAFARLIFEKKRHFTFGPDTGDLSINAENVASVLQEVGPYIQSIKGQILNKAEWDLLVNNCSNVTELELRQPQHVLHSTVTLNNSQFFANLDTLILSQCPIFDAGLMMITLMSQLRSLHLDNCWNVVGNFFSKWRNCPLRSLKINGCEKINPDLVCLFVANNRLAKFAYNAPFLQHLPAQCMSRFEELELNFSVAAPSYVDFSHLRRLTHLTVTFPAVDNYNATLATMSQMPALRSLSVERIILNAGTLPCLGRLKNLRELCLRQCNNQIGEQLYSTLHQHLPQLTDLTLDSRYILLNQLYMPNPELFQPKWICNLISSLPSLKRLTHDTMSYNILGAIFVTQRNLKRRPIQIESYGFSAEEMERFNATYGGYVNLKHPDPNPFPYPYYYGRTRRDNNQNNYSYF